MAQPIQVEKNVVRLRDTRRPRRIDAADDDARAVFWAHRWRAWREPEAIRVAETHRLPREELLEPDIDRAVFWAHRWQASLEPAKGIRVAETHRLPQEELEPDFWQFCLALRGEGEVFYFNLFATFLDAPYRPPTDETRHRSYDTFWLAG